MIQKRDYDKILYFLSHIQTDQNNYRETVLDFLHALFGFNHLTFFLTEDNCNLTSPIVINMSNELMKKYMLHYFKTDIFHPINSLPKLFQKSVLSIQDLMPYREFEKTEFYNDLLKIDRLYYELVMPLKNGDQLIGGIGIFSTKNLGEFSKKDFLILDSINRHIAFNLSNHIALSKLKHENQIYQDSTKNLPVGIILLDSKFNIINRNETAMEYCTNIASDESYRHPVLDTVKEILVKTRIQPQSSSCCIEITLHDYKIKISPFVVPSLWNSIDTYYVVHIIENIDAANPPLDKIADHYGWTAREQEIVSLIIKGLSNNEIAQNLYISHHTVKTHILNIFKKTNVSRRTALLNIINNFNNSHA